LTIHIESETDEHRIERCDHDGTTEPLAGLSSVSVCSACGKTWPTRFGAGAETVRIVSKVDAEAWRGRRIAAVVFAERRALSYPTANLIEIGQALRRTSGRQIGKGESMPARSFNLSRTAATVAAALCVAISALALVGGASAAKKSPAKPPATWKNTRANWQLSCANFKDMYSADLQAGDIKGAAQDVQMAQNAGCPWAA
jgi:hypothetical protein